MKKFVLKRKNKVYKQNDPYPKIRISQETFNTLSCWAIETGHPISKVVAKCVEFCDQNLEWQ